MGLSPYLSGALLAASLGGPPVQFGTPPYLALLEASPGPADTGATLSEPAYVGYERLAVPFSRDDSGAGGWTLDSSSTLMLSPKLELPVYQSGPAAQIIGWGLCDSPTDGELGWSGLCTPFQIDATDPAVVWAASTIIINLAS